MATARHIENRIRFALDDYKISKVEFGVLFIDIDHFKDLNDSYGHLVGDKVLRFIANTVRHNLRTSDSCGRWGGEEFLALILDINLEGVKVVAEKIRRLIVQARIQDGGQKPGRDRFHRRKCEPPSGHSRKHRSENG